MVLCAWRITVARHHVSVSYVACLQSRGGPDVTDQTGDKRTEERWRLVRTLPRKSAAPYQHDGLAAETFRALAIRCVIRSRRPVW